MNTKLVFQDLCKKTHDLTNDGKLFLQVERVSCGKKPRSSTVKTTTQKLQRNETEREKETEEQQTLEMRSNTLINSLLLSSLTLPHFPQ